jgi:hypothetical protein
MVEPSRQRLSDRFSPALLVETARAFSPQTILWFGLSLAVSAYFASEGLRQAFSGPYIMQDDARQHVFWMARFGGSGLLPNDLSADYFQAMAPHGYTALYALGAMVGIDPLLLNKLLPLALGLVTTAFCFLLCFQLLRVPSAAFVSALLLNQSLWMQDDLISATPRAFLYPLLLAFLYYVSRRAWVPALTALALQGLFYPSVVFISLGILALRLVDWRGGRPKLFRDRSAYLVFAAGLAVTAVVMIAYAWKSSGFGPVVTASEARLMPEFSATGRMRVFHETFWGFWISGQNSGMIPLSSLMPFTICSSLLLPVLMRYPQHFPLIKQLSANIKILGQLAVASILMFFAAHAVLFTLYLPSRYTQHSVRVLLSVAAGITLIIILDAAFHFFDTQANAPPIARKVLGIAVSLLIAITLVLYPGRPRNFMQTNYRAGRQPQLYEFFAQQPSNVVIASLSREADRIPSFAKRTNLVSWECSIPFHKGYYSQIRQRALDLINAQYSPDPGELRNFVRKYEVDFVVVDRRAFDADYLKSDRWFRLYEPATSDAMNRLKAGSEPALAKLMTQCASFETEDVVVVAADCILNAAPPVK